MNVLQRSLQDADRVRLLRLGVDALLAEDPGNVPHPVLELHLPLLVAHLQLPVLKYLDANLLLVVRSKHLDHVLPLGQDTLGDIAEDRRGLQNLVEILLQAVAPVNDGVLVRRDLEPLAELLVPNDRDVRQPLLAWNETWWGG